MHAAGILRDIATDGAGDLTRGIGRVIKTMTRGGFADREIANAGLNSGSSRTWIDREDAIEFGQRQQQSLAMG